jgi:transformation/transcription domain-associated protein
MDSGVLVDAIANACADSGKEFMHSSVLAFTLIKDTSMAVLGDVRKVCRLTLFDQLVRRVCALCYESAYFTRLGGCAALNYLLHKMQMPRRWCRQFVDVIWPALIDVLHGQHGEVRRPREKRAQKMCRCHRARSTSLVSVWNVS